VRWRPSCWEEKAARGWAGRERGETGSAQRRRRGKGELSSACLQPEIERGGEVWALGPGKGEGFFCFVFFYFPFFYSKAIFKTILKITLNYF